MANFNVRNLINYNGNGAVNQFVINTPKAVYFQSYESVVAKIDRKGSLILSDNWDYSNTTRKHLYISFVCTDIVICVPQRICARLSSIKRLF